MPRPTVSYDDWKCPWCKTHQRFESAAAGACAEGDLSGFVDQLTCPSRGKDSTVSLSIQFRAEAVTD
jgi:hypothetical protein